MKLDELQKLCERVQDDYWQRDPWEVAERRLKLIEVARQANRLRKASFEILKKDPSEDEWGELNSACFEVGEAIAKLEAE